jgi:hypothetical protein
MSRFEEFAESLRVGRARAEREQFDREEEGRTLQQTVGMTFQRLCDYFQCPKDQLHYVDLLANSVAGAVHNNSPPIGFNPATARKRVGLEIRLDEHPVWLYFEFVPLKHDGLEFHFAADLFQLPGEEKKFFDQIAETINRELRANYAPAAHKIGFV